MRNEQKVFLGVIAGVLIGGFYTSQSAYEQGGRAARQEIKQRLVSVGLMSSGSTRTNSLSGTIQNSTGSTFMITVMPSVDLTLPDQQPVTYTVTTNDTTQFLKRELNTDPKKRVQGASLFTEEPAPLTLFTVGKGVTVVSENEVRSLTVAASKLILVD